MPDDDDQGFGTVSGYGHDADHTEEASRPREPSPAPAPRSNPSVQSRWFDWFRRLLRR
jgi:hypothetical protein